MTSDEEKRLRRLEICRRYREKNREKTRLANKAWREGKGKGYFTKWKEQNPEKVKENRLRYEAIHRNRINKACRIENLKPERREARRAYMRKYQQEHYVPRPKKTRTKKIRTFDQLLIQEQRNRESAKRSYHKNKKKYHRRALERYHKDSNHNMAHKLRCRIRKALRDSGASKKAKMKELLGCSIECFIDYLKSLFKPGMTIELLMEGKIHIDHIRPCADFDLTKIEDQRACFHYTNMKPEWPAINWSKGSRWVG